MLVYLCGEMLCEFNLLYRVDDGVKLLCAAQLCYNFDAVSTYGYRVEEACVYFLMTLICTSHSQANYHKNNEDAEGTMDYVASHNDIVFFSGFYRMKEG
jgi:hypothetical protein